MSKHLAKNCLYKLPSGNLVHPCRLIIRDGTLMWKHAFLADPLLYQGISVYFQHSVHSPRYVYEALKEKIQPHEKLKYVDITVGRPALFFQRC